MTREDKIKLAIDKGYTCDPTTGQVFGVYKKEIKTIMPIGYMQLQILDEGKRFSLYAHHFIWYWVYGTTPHLLDHKNEIKSDNRVDNLRESTHSKNLMNQKRVKGWTKVGKKYLAIIGVNKKQYNLGMFNTPEEAHAKYLEAKKIYHKL